MDSRSDHGREGTIIAFMHSGKRICLFSDDHTRGLVVSIKQQLLDTAIVWLVECAQKDTIWACGIRVNDGALTHASGVARIFWDTR